MARKDKLSILLLDDHVDLVQLYKKQIEKMGPFQVTAQSEGGAARRLAKRQLFDAVIIDAKLDYCGVEFGGLRLAEELRPRYGIHSILVISRFITAALMRERGAQFEFMEKYGAERTSSFAQDLCRKITSMRRRQYVFVAMPFGKTMLPVYRSIKAAVKDAGFKCIRIDEVAHTRGMQETIFEHVQDSKLVVLIADGANANAYYEAGFADAMKKEVVILATDLNSLQFDVANRHTLTYGTSPSSISVKLQRKLRSLRLQAPVTI